MMILKLNLILLFLFSAISLFGQDSINIEIIHATTEKVDIRVGDDYFAKGGWYLDANKKPDIFRIGSKWNYENLEVSFITDIDSITFNAKPGNEYDFIIQLNGKVDCYIQIITSSNPVFMDWKLLSGLGIIYSVIIILFSQLSSPKSIVCLLYFGVLSSILFWLITYVAGGIHGNYEHARNVISELGTVGTKGEVFTSISFILLSIFLLAFSFGFYKESNRLNISKIPAILSFIMPFSFLWASIFPLGNEFHGLLGASPLLVVIGAFAGFFLWKKENGFNTISYWSLISGLIMLLIIIRFIRPFGQNYEGLVQRLFYLGWTIWIFMLSLNLTKMKKKLL